MNRPTDRNHPPANPSGVTRRRLALFALGALLLWPATGSLPAPAAQRLPLVYPWGDTYLNITHELVSLRVPILEESEGAFLRLRRAELDVRYRFYTEEKIGDIILAEREEEGRQRAVLERLVLEPAHPKEEAVLYAVEIRLPGLPLIDPQDPDLPNESEGASDENDTEDVRAGEVEIANPDDEASEDVNEYRSGQSLLGRLERIYGPPARNARRIRRAPAQSEQTRRERAEEEARKALDGRGRVSGGSLEYGNRDTLVRVDYEAQGGQRFARKMTFVSRVISRERNRDIEKLKKSADRKIRKKIRTADRRLRREARRKRK
ncbi:MAG: hypothetical protein NXI24_07245 [bacterium]|nr:hypothetical protein [bacterium]